MRLAIADPPYPPIRAAHPRNDKPRASFWYGDSMLSSGQGGSIPDLLTAVAPRVGFAGAKPEAWTRWILDLLGYQPDVDEVVDVFPGSGAVAAAISQGVLL